MATQDTDVQIDRLPESEIQSTINSVKKMLLLGGIFAAVGYLLVGAALFFELTEFHPLLESYFTQFPDTSLAGGSGGTRGAGVNAALASIHKWPSTLLWLKLGGIAHVLVGIFIALAAIVRVLSLMPHRLSYEMQRTQSVGAHDHGADRDHSADHDPAGGGTPADD